MCAFVCWLGVSVGNFLSSLSTHAYLFFAGVHAHVHVHVHVYTVTIYTCTVTLFWQVFFIDHDHCVTSFIDPRIPLPDHEFTYTTSSPSTTRPQQEIRFGEEVNMWCLRTCSMIELSFTCIQCIYVHEKHVHSTLAKQEFSERNPPHNPLPTNITYTKVGHGMHMYVYSVYN